MFDSLNYSLLSGEAPAGVSPLVNKMDRRQKVRFLCVFLLGVSNGGNAGGAGRAAGGPVRKLMAPRAAKPAVSARGSTLHGQRLP